jgi:hypothetical protein
LWRAFVADLIILLPETHDASLRSALMSANVCPVACRACWAIPADDRPQTQKGMRVPAGDMEGLVLERLRAFFSSRIDVSDAIAPFDLDARALDAALRNAFGLSERWLAAPPVEMKSLVREIVERVTVAADRIEIRLSQADEAGAVCGESSQHSARPRDGANTR